jgi:hypothetical protein
MSEQAPENPTNPKKKPKGVPTWVWFVGTFAAVSLLGNVVFGGNTWINTSVNFVNNTIASWQVEEDRSKDPFCLTGDVSAIDRENALAVVTEAQSLIQQTVGLIGFATYGEDSENLGDAIVMVQSSSGRFAPLGERLLTAKACNDPTFEYLMQDLGSAMVQLGENLALWTPDTLLEDPTILIQVVPILEQAPAKSSAVLMYLESLD